MSGFISTEYVVIFTMIQFSQSLAHMGKKYNMQNLSHVFYAMKTYQIAKNKRFDNKQGCVLQKNL